MFLGLCRSLGGPKGVRGSALYGVRCVGWCGPDVPPAEAQDELGGAGVGEAVGGTQGGAPGEGGSAGGVVESGGAGCRVEGGGDGKGGGGGGRRGWGP